MGAFRGEAGPRLVPSVGTSVADQTRLRPHPPQETGALASRPPPAASGSTASSPLPRTPVAGQQENPFQPKHRFHAADWNWHKGKDDDEWEDDDDDARSKMNGEGGEWKRNEKEEKGKKIVTMIIVMMR